MAENDCGKLWTQITDHFMQHDTELCKTDLIKSFDSWKYPAVKVSLLCLSVAGAMFASLEIIGSRSLLRDQYLKGVPLPDWCVLSGPDDKTAATK